jgi:hypothetical protein
VNQNHKNHTFKTSEQTASVKTIIAHYHLFKNAGTSVDTILKQNFGSTWQEVEFKRISRKSNLKLVEKWLIKHQEIKAFSSHTAMFPLPTIANTTLIPIVFLRHPIDRLWSVYKFERRHKKVLNHSIKIAQKYDFAGYLNYHLDRMGDRSCRNFQTYRFSFLDPQSNLVEFAKAMNGLNSLPMVGIVEEFDRSMQYYASAIVKHYSSFQAKSVRRNTTSHHNLSLAEKLDTIENTLDTKTYQRLLDANRDDLELYEAARRKLFAYQPEQYSAVR